MEALAFAVLGAGLLLASLLVVTAKSPLRSALALIFVQVQLAALYVVLDAPFVAAMQVLVYAGAVMVLFVFVIMLLNLGDEAPSMAAVPWSKWAGGAGALAVLLAVAYHAASLPSPGMMPPMLGQVRDIGALLLGRFLFAFEASSLLLLTSVVGAVVLGLKRLVS